MLGNNLPWFMKIFRSFSPIKPTCEALCISELSNWQTEGNSYPNAFALYYFPLSLILFFLFLIKNKKQALKEKA